MEVKILNFLYGWRGQIWLEANLALAFNIVQRRLSEGGVPVIYFSSNGNLPSCVNEYIPQI
jgi:hypothetical protein